MTTTVPDGQQAVKSRTKHSIPRVRMDDSEAKKKAELFDDLVKAVMEGLAQEDNGRLKAAVALKEIWDAKLWPQNMSWPEFVVGAFDHSEEWAKQLIAFVAVRDSIQGKILPERERQTRALRKADEGEWQSIWDRAIEKSGGKQPTGRLIELLIEADEKKRKALAQVEKKQEALDREKEEVKQQDVFPRFTLLDNEGHIPDDADLDENDDGQPGEDDPNPTDLYLLKVNLKVGGAVDFSEWEETLREKFTAERTNVRGERLGMKFDCLESGLPNLMALIEDLLNDKIDSLELAIEKQPVVAAVESSTAATV